LGSGKKPDHSSKTFGNKDNYPLILIQFLK
jgi:hypothetical protein